MPGRIVLTKGGYHDLCELVSRRDHHACIICGRPAGDHHHVVFRSQCGPDAEDNLVTLCRECHSKYAHGADEKHWQNEFEEYLASDEIENWRRKHFKQIHDIERRVKK